MGSINHDDLRKFLSNLGSEVLTGIARSDEPLTLGFGDKRTILRINLPAESDKYTAQLSVYRLGRWGLGSPKLTELSSVHIGRAGSSLPIKDAVTRSVESLSGDTLEAVWLSKEPITFTIADRSGTERQIEVRFTSSNNSNNNIIHETFVD